MILLTRRCFDSNQDQLGECRLRLANHSSTELETSERKRAAAATKSNSLKWTLIRSGNPKANARTVASCANRAVISTAINFAFRSNDGNVSWQRSRNLVSPQVTA